MKIISRWPIAVCSLAFVVLSACQKDPVSFEERKLELTDREQVLVHQNNALAVQMYKQLQPSPQAKQNLFFSPYSLGTVLSMTANGAVGETQKEIYQALGLTDYTPDEINTYHKKLISTLPYLDQHAQVRLSNSIWHRKVDQVVPGFLETSTSNYLAKVAGVDFEDANTLTLINDYINQETNGMVPKFLEEIPENQTMMLLNSIYFKADWAQKFDKNETKPGQFHTLNDGVVEVPFMCFQAKTSGSSNSDYEMVKLPYKNNKFEMMLFQPATGKSLAGLQELLQSKSTMERLMQPQKTFDLKLYLPKFKVRHKQDLIPTLKALGMKTAFMPGKADFSQLLASVESYISIVKQEAVVEVDEAGTVAAAVTQVGLEVTSEGPNQPKTMRFDQPFIFMIREVSSGLILFMGQINNPKI